MPAITPKRDESDLLRHPVYIGHGQQLNILSDPINSWGYATGNTLWTSSEELITFFDTKYPEGHFKGKTVLELGAGLGAVGMALAKKGARVVITDRPEILELMQRNVEENFMPDEIGVVVQVCCLEWGTPKALLPPPCRGPFDIVVGSDIVYGRHSDYLRLVSSLMDVTDENTDIIFGIPKREESKHLARDLLRRRFKSQRLATIMKPHFENPVVIYRLSRLDQQLRPTTRASAASAQQAAPAHRPHLSVSFEHQPCTFMPHAHHHHHHSQRPLRSVKGAFDPEARSGSTYSPMWSKTNWRCNSAAGAEADPTFPTHAPYNHHELHNDVGRPNAPMDYASCA